MSFSLKHICVLDTQPLFRAALGEAIERGLPGCQVSLYDNEHQFMRRLTSGLEPDVIVYDVMANGVSGVLGLKYLHAQFPRTRIVALSSLPIRLGPEAHQQLGISAFLSRMADVDLLVSEVRRLALEGRLPAAWTTPTPSGEFCLLAALERMRRLSPRRYRALVMIAEGRLNKVVAWEIGASEATVKGMVTMFLRMFNLKTRTELAITIARLDMMLLLGLGEHLPAGQALAARAA